MKFCADEAIAPLSNWRPSSIAPVKFGSCEFSIRPGRERLLVSVAPVKMALSAVALRRFAPVRSAPSNIVSVSSCVPHGCINENRIGQIGAGEICR